MAVKNKIAVWIDGINRTCNLVLPLKCGNFLDERLDECHLALRGIRKENFQPLMPVEIQITNEIFWGVKEKVTETATKEVRYYVVADDSATEVLLGKGVYNHDLFLIEVTKVAECCVVDTLTFTNDLGRTYTTNSSYATPQWE